ncbi:MAG: DUF4260 family protein [Chitinophagaceae bacterium]|nr:MAG: DUF4260 family protein [Chitinophagaceae bacterium]
MKVLLQLEQFSLFLGCIYLFSRLKLKWWWFPALLLVPDLGMVGYLINPAVGAVIYNIVHFQGTAVVIGVYGWSRGNRALMLAGVILLAHSTMDRAIGTGLKYFDGFWHTSLSNGVFW